MVSGIETRNRVKRGQTAPRQKRNGPRLNNGRVGQNKGEKKKIGARRQFIPGRKAGCRLQQLRNKSALMQREAADAPLVVRVHTHESSTNATRFEASRGRRRGTRSVGFSRIVGSERTGSLESARVRAGGLGDIIDADPAGRFVERDEPGRRTSVSAWRERNFIAIWGSYNFPPDAQL